MNNALVATFMLLGTWFTAYLGAYFAEKGKNTATKDDIAQITKQIEAVKHEFMKAERKSSAFIDGQLNAYKAVMEISGKLRRLSIIEYSSDAARRDNAFIMEMLRLSQLLMEVENQHHYFLIGDVEKAVGNLVSALGNYPGASPVIAGQQYHDLNFSPVIQAEIELKHAIQKELSGVRGGT